MAVQTSYSFSTSRGAPGGIYDLTPRAVNSRSAEEKILFGIGVVQGSVPGSNIAMPTKDSTAAEFEGVSVNGGTQEMDLEGKTIVKAGASVSVMRHGRVWVRVEKDAEIAYGEDAYLITNGDFAGYFTNADSEATKVAVAGRFIGTSGTDGIAPVELFNAPAPAGSPSISGLSDVDLSTPATNGQTLKYNSTSQTWKPGT